MRQTIEWRRPDPVCATTAIFESGKGQAIRKRCHVNVNRDVTPRVMRDGTYKAGKIHRRPTATEFLQFNGVPKRTSEKPSAELLERAKKNSARFDRRFYF